LAVHELPDYNADPPCKTFRKLSQKQQQKPPEPTARTVRSAANHWCYGKARMGVCLLLGYPKCKYIKQN